MTLGNEEGQNTQSPVDSVISQIRTRIVRMEQLQKQEGVNQPPTNPVERLKFFLDDNKSKVLDDDTKITDEDQADLLNKGEKVRKWVGEHGPYDDDWEHPEWKGSNDMTFNVEELKSGAMSVHVYDKKRDLRCFLTLKGQNYNLELQFTAPGSDSEVEEGTYSSGESQNVKDMPRPEGIITNYYLGAALNQLDSRSEPVKAEKAKKEQPFRSFINDIEDLDKI